MGADSKIQWTDHTFNPWWGCARVSPGCEHCYAEAFAKRTGKAKWGVNEERMVTSAANWKLPLKWNRNANPRARVFCASMADVFEDREDLEMVRERLWSLIAETKNLDWLLLTKRPQNFKSMLPWIGISDPWPNVWLGTTVEDQKRADERMPHLASTPAAVRFLSCEPLLGPVDLRTPTYKTETRSLGIVDKYALDVIDWVIVGGESGFGARPFDVDWARAVVDQARGVGARPFMKQLGAKPIGTPRVLADKKGGDWDDPAWPADLRVREFPVVRQ